MTNIDFSADCTFYRHGDRLAGPIRVDFVGFEEFDHPDAFTNVKGFFSADALDFMLVGEDLEVEFGGRRYPCVMPTAGEILLNAKVER